MPDLASRRLARTSCVLLPMDETMPIPVTTTRLIVASSASARSPGSSWLFSFSRASGAARLQHCRLTDQPHPEIVGAEYDGAIGRHPAVGNAEHELRAHHPLDVDAVYDLL